MKHRTQAHSKASKNGNDQPTPLVYQIYYDRKQRSQLDKRFVPYFNYPNDPVFCEYKVMHDNYLRDSNPPSQLVGFFSWKFSQKTGIDGKQFFNFIRSNPGYDVYFINPFPENAFLFYNIWYNGEYFHRNLIEASSELLAQARFKLNIERQRHDLGNLCFCNFWVGNSYFWDKYLALTEPLYRLMCTDRHFRKVFLHGKADRNSNIPLFPYFMERIFTTLLASDPSIKACPYFHSEIYPRCEKHLTTKLLLFAVKPIVDSIVNKCRVTIRDIRFLNSIGHLFYDWLESDIKHDDAYFCMSNSLGLQVKNTLFGHKTTVRHQIIQRVHEMNRHFSSAANIYIFGTGSCSEIVTAFLDRQKFLCSGYFDNDQSKSGKIFNGLPIMKPYFAPDTKVITASIHAKDMYKQLRSLGYESKNILLLNPSR